MNAPVNPQTITPQVPTAMDNLARPGTPLALAIWFDDRLFDRAKLIAKYISEAEGFAPAHLVGKPAACFAVVVRAITWKLDPYAVAMATYQTPGGRVGFEGKLCQAIIENSGKIDGAVTYEYHGDWSKVQGKFRIQEGQRGGKYPVPDWPTEAEAGLGVTVRCQVTGETTRREFRLDLVQAFPRNSTLWALDPKTQLGYLAVRRFGSVAVPGLFMGVPFDREDIEQFHIGPDQAKDVTPPRPTRDQFQPTETAAPPAPADVPLPEAGTPPADRQGGSTVYPADVVHTAAAQEIPAAGAEADTSDEAPADEAAGQDSTGDPNAPWTFRPLRGPEKPYPSYHGAHNALLQAIGSNSGDKLGQVMSVNSDLLDRMEKVYPEQYAQVIDAASAKGWEG